MSWAGKQHPVESVVEWIAPIPLALAVGWASARLGLAPSAALGLAVGVLMAGFAAIRFGGGARPVPLQSFEPAELAAVELDELLLEDKDAVLELTDRLEHVTPDSRVVRLFERGDPTPGELVDRIVDFLADGRRPAPVNGPAIEAARAVDASAALHDALANIRASLR